MDEQTIKEQNMDFLYLAILTRSSVKGFRRVWERKPLNSVWKL